MNRIILRLCCVVAAVLAIGCGERSSETSAPQHYGKGGMSFDYPGNWTMTKDTVDDPIHYLTNDSPGNAIVAIYLFPQEAAPELTEFARMFSSSMTDDDLIIGSLGPSTFGTVEQVGGYESLDEQFSVSVMNETVPHTRTYRRKAVNDKIYLVMAQVADEDRPKVNDGFEQIYSSLKYVAE
jgi:hypothetical protein